MTAIKIADLYEDAIGKFARSIETGSVGRIEKAKMYSDEILFKLSMVDNIAHMVGGGSLESCIDPDDVRWYDPRDLVWLNKQKIEIPKAKYAMVHDRLMGDPSIKAAIERATETAAALKEAIEQVDEVLDPVWNEKGFVTQWGSPVNTWRNSERVAPAQQNFAESWIGGEAMQLLAEKGLSLYGRTACAVAWDENEDAVASLREAARSVIEFGSDDGDHWYAHQFRDWIFKIIEKAEGKTCNV